MARTERMQAFASYAFVDREDYTDDAGRTADALEVSPHKVIAGASLGFFGNRASLSAYHVYNSSAEGLALRVDATDSEIVTVPAYHNLTIAAATRGRVLGFDVVGIVTADNVLDTDNVRPNMRGLDPSVYPQNSFNLRATLRVLFDR